MPDKRTSRIDAILNIGFIFIMLISLFLLYNYSTLVLSTILMSFTIILYGIAGIVRKRFVTRLYAVNGIVAIIYSSFIVLIGIIFFIIALSWLAPTS